MKEGWECLLRRPQRLRKDMHVVGAFEPSHVGETQQVRNGGFTATVLVGTVGMKAVAATAGFDID